MHALNSKARFVLAKSMFDADGAPRIDLTAVNDIRVVDERLQPLRRFLAKSYKPQALRLR
jgi:hypothetical protein